MKKSFMAKGTAFAVSVAAAMALSGCFQLPASSSQPVSVPAPVAAPPAAPVSAPFVPDEQAYLNIADQALLDEMIADFGAAPGQVTVEDMRAQPEYPELRQSMLDVGYMACGVSLLVFQAANDQSDAPFSTGFVTTVYDAAQQHLCEVSA